MPENASNDLQTPRPLLVAVFATLLEAVVFGVLTVVQAVSFSGERAAMNGTTVLGFALWGLLLAGSAAALLRRNSWARGPIVMAQLIHLGVAWSFVQGDPSRGAATVAWLIAAAAVVVLVGVFHPRSLRHLAALDA